jgi:hypothetical protein
MRRLCGRQRPEGTLEDNDVFGNAFSGMEIKTD